MDELGKTQEHYGQKLKVGAVLESSWLESDLQFWTFPRKTRSTYGRIALGKYPQLASRQIRLPVL
jgi:hypothetical protein